MIPVWIDVAVIVAGGIVLGMFAYKERREPRWQNITYRHRCRMPEKPPYRGELAVCRIDDRCSNWYLGKGTYWVRLTWLGKLRRNLL